MARITRRNLGAKRKRKRKGKDRLGRTLEERHRLGLTPSSQRKRIIELFKTGRTLYFSTIADELNFDIRTVVEICKSLMRQGKIHIAEEPPGEDA